MPSNSTNIDLAKPAVGAARSPKQLVVIADRNPVLGEVLANHLSADSDLVCDFVATDENLCSEIARLAPDVFMLDPMHLKLRPDNDISDFVKKVRVAHPQTKLLGYSFKVSLAMIRATIEAGFHGCISKNARLQEVEAALAVVLAGGMCFDKECGSQLRPMLAENTTDDPLSEREKEVLIGFARGQSAKQIAHDLQISSKTVDTYKARATQKLDLGDRAKLVHYVMTQGWLN
ncbi:MAG: response regulator transcription factor [Pseudomonadota bacterium]